ncbi:bifunctional ADP-dependent NAD(P)H-hydrate dehydratase/NAD(P)H-hydrate epimerase [Halodesulfovibrio marinisediminis]|uniref:Bifunctional NAD(P)H-hydrate repair enzyme n=1 Tax=Halodesulfovibrio marinisediminis DSM 17456 TaxID=1121457 RepID=A0A1N6DYZ7_9BACT|nr:bifunctional ADP-dependent NAD(P)H-hydrate dehydratase/NAD(P)H-hydrate epimerase [Halodesulfovibrio marinisediminis]SIN75995.1 NAD(P)H-hydrate epimerase [Halodesulfovibrio marinisediminis DSM 17456]
MAYIPLPTPAEMNSWDTQAITTFGIREEILMENASREALHVLLELTGSVTGKRVLAFMGSGNNGGDAAATARHLHNLGAEVLLLHTKPVRAYNKTSGYHFKLARTIGTPYALLTSKNASRLLSAEQPDIIIDGLLGTGLRGTLSSDKKSLIEHINRLGQKAFVFALDIPSGLNGTLGTVDPVAVRANATVTFEAAKCGLVMPEARQWIGDLYTRSIGIPTQVQDTHSASYYGMTDDVLRLRKPQSEAMHKGSAGKVLIIGGSKGLTGAPHLSALGAMRSGAGYATVASPALLTQEIKAGQSGILTLELGISNEWPIHVPEVLIQEIQNSDSLIIGPGMGRSKEAANFLRKLITRHRPPTVFDADALYHLAKDENLIQSLSDSDILTPHPGEMARLSRKTISEIQADRLTAATILNDTFNGVVVLKGAASCIAQQGRPTVISPFCTPTLAVAGSGDVLSGIIGTHLAQGVPVREAACLGVYEHGLAGEFLENDFPHRGNLPQEIAHALPKAIRKNLCSQPTT